MSLSEKQINWDFDNKEGLKQRPLTCKKPGEKKERNSFLKYKSMKTQNIDGSVLFEEQKAENPLYCKMKTQNIINTMLQGIFELSRKQRLKKQRINEQRLAQKSRFQTEPVHIHLSKSYLIKRQNLNSSIQKIKQLNQQVRYLHSNMGKSRKRLGILDKYHEVVTSHESDALLNVTDPSLFAEKQNEAILKMCQENFFVNRDKYYFMEKAEKLKKYIEPEFQQKKKKKLSRRRRQGKSNKKPLDLLKCLK